jgi:BirA family biotin operon repressor/biotin-[acetyl-CoA-carboxylase] ligase
MIIRKKTLDSTNKYALNLLKENQVNTEKFDNCLIYALTQTAGRGRYGKNWHSPEGNLYASFIIDKPSFPIYASLWICGLAVLDSLKSLAPDMNLWLKWPNDIYYTFNDNNSKYAKISGLLAETFLKPAENSVQSIVCGMGVNLNMDNNDLAFIQKPAVSIFSETGRNVDLTVFVELLFEQLCKYRKIAETDFDAFFLLWSKANKLKGLNISIAQDNGNIVSGLVTGVSKNGALILNNEQYSDLHIVSGDVISFS